VRKFKAIIFDLGNVVFDVSFERVFQSWALASGHDARVLEQKFLFDAFIDAFERGEISDAEFRVEISKRLHLNLRDDAFDAGWCDLYLAMRRGMDELLMELKQRYRLVALTNTNRIHARVWTKKYSDSLKIFDRIFSSHEMNARKPEAKAYQDVIRYLELRPQEAIFLDDAAVNIEGAAVCGLSTIHVHSHAQMLVDLREMLND